MSADELIGVLRTLYKDTASIEVLTRNQADSEDWYEYIGGLVTASIAHACMTRASSILAKQRVDPGPFINLILRKKSVCIKAMREGAEKEKAAKVAFCQLQMLQGHQVTLMQAGFVVLEEIPVTGCSPDVIVACSCKCCEGKEVLFEIKCPQQLKNSFSNFDTRTP